MIAMTSSHLVYVKQVRTMLVDLGFTNVTQQLEWWNGR